MLWKLSVNNIEATFESHYYERGRDQNKYYKQSWVHRFIRIQNRHAFDATGNPGVPPSIGKRVDSLSAK